MGAIDDIRIKVTWPDDNTVFIITTEEFRERFRDEDPGWFQGVLDMITSQGYVFDRWGVKYELIKKQS